MLGPGTQIGRYVVTRKLAEGGMAEIYLASAVGPEGFSKEVAIKVVRSFLATDPQFVQMFIAEARLASRLNHANVVQIFDFGKHEDTYYLAMEYVRGASLWDLRQRCRQDGIPFPPVLAAELGVQVARGLQYAHTLTYKGQKLGVVHRDVTPHNVLLSFDGAVKLTDFGIAKAQTTHTAPGMLKGKFAYMSPEQARGDPVDARTDIFALGIVLWELLTGGKLFDGDSELAVLRAVESSVIAPPARLNPDVPQDLSDIVMKALARPLPERFQSAFEMEKALATWVLRTAQSMEDTSIALFLEQVYGPEVREEARAGTPAHGAAAVVRTDGDEDFAHGDTMAVDRSQEIGRRLTPQKTMTMTPVRATARNATPRPRGVMDDDDASPTGTEKFESLSSVPTALPADASRRTSTELIPAYEPGHAPAPARPKTEQYRPVSRRLEPLVIVDASVEPSKVASLSEPPPASAPTTPAGPDGQSVSTTAPAAPEELPQAARPSRGWLVAGASVALVGLLAAVAFFATREPEVTPAPPEIAGTGVEVPNSPRSELVAPPAPTPVAEAKPPEPEKPATPTEQQVATPDKPGEKAEPSGTKVASVTAGPKKRELDKEPTKPPDKAPKAMGTLTVRAIPYAQVSLPGRPTVEVDAPKSFSVPAGTIEVTFRHPKKTLKTKVTVKAGETVRLDFDANAP
jgi:serine/threonine-protein kinase